MGLAEQERALLALVFDAEVRRAFIADPRAALLQLGVPATDHDDFLTVSSFGLQIDARDRQLLVLSRLAKSFPLSVAATSAVPEGLALVKRLVGPAHFEVAVAERPARFGQALCHALTRHGDASVSDDERGFLVSLARFETACAVASARARLAAQDAHARVEPTEAIVPPSTWLVAPLSLAPGVAVAKLPASPSLILRQLTGSTDVDALWAQLCQSPVPRSRLQQARQPQGEGVVVVCRAVITRASLTDAEVGQRTLELAGGFAFLLGGLDGRRSATTLLDSLGAVGAPRAVLDGVRESLLRLVREGMVMCGSASSSSSSSLG